MPIAMWPFSRKQRFPGVKPNSDGTIEFSLTDEEAREIELAMKTFEGVLIHPEFAERIPNGTMAVALSHYAKALVAVHCVGVSASEYKANRPAIRGALQKAVAAVWKSYSLCPLPIFLYHRASFFQMLGMRDEARQLFALFLEKHSDFKMDQLDKLQLDYEGTNIEEALSHAKLEA